jgi:hypothetical protein
LAGRRRASRRAATVHAIDHQKATSKAAVNGCVVA